MIDVNNFESMKIGLASPEQIFEWSHGEVKKPETINYRTLKPERDGLFCEKIFGPVKDWECHCGKYKRVRFKGVICDKCGVEVTRSKVRRERMGHISLASPVTHIWYFKGVPSRIGLLLNMSPRILEKIIYFAAFVVIDPKDTPLDHKQLLTEMEYRKARKEYGNDFVAMMGAEAIRELLRQLDLDSLYEEMRDDVKKLSGQKRSKAIKRLGVVDSFRKSGNKPEWMILEKVPVIPPELRPMVQLDGGRFATSDLNDLYRRVINRNNRLKRLLELGAPEIIVKNEKRMLQEAVDALIDNGRRGRPVTGPNNRPLKSLSDMLKGKQGRFRQNLLGKRVDYSGRSVIVVGPKLKLHQCGLPKEMALELFKPFVMKKLVERGLVHNIKSAKKWVERIKPEVWDVLEEVIKDHPVMLNRAPTLHRLGIQAFVPLLVEGKAIQIHPLVCTPYNADFDGDQMAVHLPLSASAQAEARILMLSSNNILQPSYGSPATIPTQDMVLGIYYLTYCYKNDPRVMKSSGITHKLKGEGMAFSSLDEAILAYDEGVIELQAPIRVLVPYPDKTVEEVFMDENGCYYDILSDKLVETTVGRAIFYKAIPGEFRFATSVKSRIHPDDKVQYLNDTFNKKKLVRFVSDFHSKFKNKYTAYLLDNIKDLGFKYATVSGSTISIGDVCLPPSKPDILKIADEKVETADNFYLNGYTTSEEKDEHSIRIWQDATRKVEMAMMENFDSLNPIYMMATSGARGNPSQVKQIAGMRGLMSDPSGKTIPLPVKASLREGLSVLEYFISTHGARKGLADTALRTADSGYLTRRLIDVAQDVIVREWDCQKRIICQMCGAKNSFGDVECSKCEEVLDYKIPKNILDVGGEYIYVDVLRITEDLSEAPLLYERIRGRTLAEDLFNPETGEMLAQKGTLLSDREAEAYADIFFTYLRKAWSKFRDRQTAYISPEEILKWQEFMQDLHETKDPVKLKIINSLDEDSREYIREWKEGIIPGRESQLQLLNGINNILKNNDFYNDKLFKELITEPEIVALVEKNAGNTDESENFLINRYIFEALYSKMVETCKDKQVEQDDPDYFERFMRELGEEKTKVAIRSVLTCKTRRGVCSVCYGRDLATGDVIEIGETVGIIAAQSIGEPGTQLTLRTFHLGGVAVEDIIQGLPRVEELFEGRKPKGFGVISDIEGYVAPFGTEKNMRKIVIKSLAGDDKEDKSYKVPFSTKLLIKVGDHVKAGQKITEGNKNPHDILRVEGVKEVQRYLVDEIQDVYRSQGVDINDKHCEVIVRQMLRRVKIETPGDANFLPGALVDIFDLEDENRRVLAENQEPATAKPVLLGVTKASLATESFLSAASFQETTRVLTDAAIKGKIDNLIGLKENVIIGKLIPAGTGMQRYRNTDIKVLRGDSDEVIEEEELYKKEVADDYDEDEDIGIEMDMEMVMPQEPHFENEDPDDEKEDDSDLDMGEFITMDTGIDLEKSLDSIVSSDDEYDLVDADDTDDDDYKEDDMD